MAYATPRPARFYRQRVFYGGLIAGFVIFPLLVFALGWVLSHHVAATPKPGPDSGNMTITLDDDVLTLGMTMGLARVKSQVPFEVTNTRVTTKVGDHIEVHADGNFGPIVIGMDMTLGTVVDATGHLAFQIKAISAAGADLSLFGFTNARIEDALDQQFADLGSGSFVKGLSYQLTNVRTEAGALVVSAKLVKI
ncbi:MAG: hypothetical protein H0X24_02785 [Ktedonobacterales bacterium]|nr:hypothetical protein [Ktedonobacterales bacterium]